MTVTTNNVRRALRIWHKDRSQESPLNNLCLFNQLRLKGNSIRRATNQVLFNGLEVLQTLHPKDADLLRQRFLDGQSVQLLLNQLNVRDTKFYEIQKEAIGHLVEVISEMEREALTLRQRCLEKRLKAPTYRNLIGVKEHLKQLRKVLVSKEQSCMVCISGIGGIGKTSLADALVREMIGQGFFEDFAWVSAQQQEFNLGGVIKSLNRGALTVEALVERLAKQFLDLTPKQLSSKQTFDVLRHHLKEYPHLIVIDNLETCGDVESLLSTLHQLANPSKILLTSRQGLFYDPGVYHFKVPELSPKDALELIRKEAKQRNLPHLAKANDEILRAIYETVGGNPLALRLIVGQTYIHHLSVVLDDLARCHGKSVENLYNYIYRRAWDNLDDVTRGLFLAMPLVTTQGGLLSHMAHITQLEPAALRNCLHLLVALNLVDVRHDLMISRYSIHNLVRTFLHEQVAKWL